MKGSREELLKALRSLGTYKVISNQIKFNCPKCEDELGMLHNKFNLEVNYTKNAHHCWACGQHGTLYDLIKKYGYKEYLSLFKTEKSDEIDFRKEEIRKEVELPRYIKCALNCPETKEYLLSRGLTEKKILQREISICYGGFYNGQIVFPSYNSNKELTFVLYHDFKNNQYRKRKSSSFICFYENFIDRHSLITLTEGVYDAFSAPNAIPLLGNEINKELLEFLADCRVLLILDSDLDKKIIQNRIKQLKSVCKEVLIYKLNAIRKDLNAFYTEDAKMVQKELKVYYN